MAKPESKQVVLTSKVQYIEFSTIWMSFVDFDTTFGSRLFLEKIEKLLKYRVPIICRGKGLTRGLMFNIPELRTRYPLRSGLCSIIVKTDKIPLKKWVVFNIPGTVSRLPLFQNLEFRKKGHFFLTFFIFFPSPGYLPGLRLNPWVGVQYSRYGITPTQSSKVLPYFEVFQKGCFWHKFPKSRISAGVKA